MSATVMAIAPITRQTLRDVVGIFFYKKKVFLSVFFGILLGAFLIAFLSPSRYEVSAELLVKPALTKPFTVDPAQGAFYTSEVTLKDLNTIIFLLMSSENLERTVQRLGLVQSADAKQVQVEVQKLRARIKAEPQTESNVVRVTFSGAAALETTQTLRNLLDTFKDYYIEINRVPGGLKFFETQTELLRQRYQQLNDSIEKASSKGGVIDPTLQRQTLLELIRDLERERATRNTEFDALHTKTAEIGAALKRFEDKREGNLVGLPKTSVLEYVTLNEMEKSLAQLTINLQRAQSDYQLNSKPVLDAQAQYDNMRKQIRQYMTQIISDMQSQQSSVHRGIQSIEERIAIAQKKATQLVGNALPYEQLQMERKLVEDHYKLYSDKQEEARIRDAKDVAGFANVSLAAAPQLPSGPVFPRPGLIMALALVLAPLVGLGTAAAMYSMEQRLRTPTDIALQTPLKVLGSLDSLFAVGERPAAFVVTNQAVQYGSI